MSRHAHVDPADRTGSAFVAVAITALLASAGHLYALDTYSLRWVAVAIASFIGGGGLVVAAQIAHMYRFRPAVPLGLTIVGGIFLAVPMIIFWAGRS